MFRLRLLRLPPPFRNAKNLSSVHPRKRPSLLDEVTAFLNDKPDHDPTTFIFRRLKKAHPRGNVPLSDYNSLFDWLTQHNHRHAAINVFAAMRKAGYASMGSMEAKMLVMLMEDWDPEHKAMQRALAERLVSLVQDDGFTEKDMYDVLCLAQNQGMDKRVMFLAIDSFRRGKGDIDTYIPALDLLPVAVEAAVRGGSVDEALAMLEEVVVAFREELPTQGSPITTACVSPELSIRRDLGSFRFKSRSAAQQSLRVAYGALLTSLRDVGAWKADIHIVGRVLRGLEAAKVPPDTALLNLVMLQFVYTKQYTQVVPTYKDMRWQGLMKGQPPDELTYNVLFGMWEALRGKPSLHKGLRRVAPRTLFCDLILLATDPLDYKDIPASASIPTLTTPDNKITVRTLTLNEELLMCALRAFLTQEDYAGAYVALSYMTSKVAGVTINSWHAVYYVVVHHLIRRVFAEPPGAYGQAKWAEGFLGTSLRSKDADVSLSNGTWTQTRPVGSAGGSKKAHKPIGSVRLPLNAQTTNYLLEVIARKKWSITDPLYPVSGDLPADSTHLFFPFAPAPVPSDELGPVSNSNGDTTPSSPTSTRTSGGHQFKYSVPSMFMMEHVAPPNLPPGFAWAVEPLQRLLLRALYADEVLAYRMEGRSLRSAAGTYADRPPNIPRHAEKECALKVEQRLRKTCDSMLPLPKHQSAVPLRLE